MTVIQPSLTEVAAKLKALEMEASKREAAESALGRSWQQLRDILDNSSTVVFVKDLAGRYLLINRRYEELFHVDEESIYGRTDHDLFPAAVAERFSEHDRIVLRVQGPVEFEEEVPHDDGVHHYISVKFPLRSPDGETYAVCGIATDITERKRAQDALETARKEMENSVRERTAELKAANCQLLSEIAEREAREKELRENREKYKTLTENLNVGVYRNTAGPSGRFLEANPAIVEMFGYSDREEFLSISVAELYRDPGERRCFSDTLLKEGFIRGAKLRLKRKDGTLFVGAVSAVAVRSENGDVEFYDGTIEDISERLLLEEQLSHAQKLEAIGTLAGGIAHDFNNLLMSIQGYVSLMAHDVGPSHPHYDALQKIEGQVNSGARLASHLLGYARKGRYEIAAIDLNRLITDTLETFSRARREQTIHMRLDGSLARVEGDRGQLEQLLLNLCINAADAMPKGGELTVSTRNVTHEELQGKTYRPEPGPYIELSISDTGVGMDNATRERVFDPFFTTKEMGRGTGLGLASVYGTVKGHKGYVDVESEISVGSTFTVYLPASDAVLPSVTTAKGAVTNGNETVLLVDDEPLVLEVAAAMLERLGYTVMQAKSGFQAVEIFGQFSTSIDLVVLDMIMPGQGGAETFDRLLEIDPAVRVLLSSGYSSAGLASDILARGCRGFLKKPFSLREVSGKIRSVLDDPSSPD